MTIEGRLQFIKKFPELEDCLLVNLQKNRPIMWIHNLKADILFSGVEFVQRDDIEAHCFSKKKVFDTINIVREKFTSEIGDETHGTIAIDELLTELKK